MTYWPSCQPSPASSRGLRWRRGHLLLAECHYGWSSSEPNSELGKRINPIRDQAGQVRRHIQQDSVGEDGVCSAETVVGLAQQFTFWRESFIGDDTGGESGPCAVAGFHWLAQSIRFSANPI